MNNRNDTAYSWIIVSICLVGVMIGIFIGAILATDKEVRDARVSVIGR